MESSPMKPGMWWVVTSKEDRTLQAELEGYAEYTERVRSRLMPFVW